MNRDPIGEKGGVNLYAFCLNSPVSYYDLLGNSAKSETFCDALCCLWKKEEELGGPTVFADKVFPTWFRHIPCEYYPPKHDEEGNLLAYGKGGENFIHSDGLTYDIQYLQVGFSITLKGEIVARAYFNYYAFSLFAFQRITFDPTAFENFQMNKNGFSKGMKGAHLGSVKALFDEECPNMCCTCKLEELFRECPGEKTPPREEKSPLPGEPDLPPYFNVF